MRARLVLPALALLSACEEPASPASCSVVLPALEVEVADQVTGANLAPGATGYWVSGDFAGTLRLDSPIPEAHSIAVYGPAGRYSVIVQHAGYRPWGRDDIHVRNGDCGMETVRLRVEMAPDAYVPVPGAD